MSYGTLYVVPAINAMGPVVDPRHDDLLSTWDEIDACLARAYTESYRLRYPDSAGGGIMFSFFCISWSGFTTNPVQRQFGWHTIFDHYRRVFGAPMERWGDRLYWMYNHPPASGVGNEWGMDWFQNTHYLNILNHFVIDRAYFPCAVEVPTERNDTSHFLEQWIPFDFGNRNARSVNLQSVNADGKLTGEVIEWRQAPHDWSHYHPSPANYQRPGDMRRTIFRILDIKSIVHVLTEDEIEQAFLRCLEGHDTVLCAYEHDFRDRYETIMALLIEPVHRLRRRYPEVSVRYASAQTAAQAVCGLADRTPPDLDLLTTSEGLRLTASEPLFGAGPYVCVYDPGAGSYLHLPLTRIGERVWQFPGVSLPGGAIVGAGANDLAGNATAVRWRLDGRGTGIAARLPATFRLEPDPV